MGYYTRGGAIHRYLLNLIVEDKPVIGWHGNDNFITVTPHDFRPRSSNSTWGFEDEWDGNTHGGGIRFEAGTEGYGTFTIPLGYKITGYSLTFENEPDNIDLYTCNTGHAGYSTTNTQTSESYQSGSYSYWEVIGLSIDSAPIENADPALTLHISRYNRIKTMPWIAISLRERSMGQEFVKLDITRSSYDRF